MIDVDNLSFRYPGADEPTLRGLTFAVGEGEARRWAGGGDAEVGRRGVRLP